MADKTPQVRSRVWQNGKLEAKDFPFEDISEHLKDPKKLVWVDLHNPDEKQLQKLAAELSLDPLAVEDAVATHERTKATQYQSHIFITAWVVKPVKFDKHHTPGDQLMQSCFEKGRISVFVMPHGIVTVRNNDIFDMDEVVQRWDENAELIKYGPAALVHGLLDVIVDSHFEVVQLLDDHIEMLEDQLFDDKGKAKNRLLQQRTYRVRKDLVELRRVVLPMRDVMNAIMRRRQDINSAPELNPWYDDLYDHVLRAAEWTESLRDMVTAIFETNLSLQDNRLNMIMKQLTAWAAIIAVPTAVTGYFGQNVPYPGFGQPFGFFESLAMIIVIAAVLYVVFKRKEWL